MNKKEALKIIIDSAKKYQENLENKKVIFIYKEKGKIKYIEAIFLPRNFLHLTGIQIKNSNIKSSIDFYHLCLKNRISILDFDFKENGTTIMKLQILSQIIQIQKLARSIGEYNYFKPILVTDKLAGTNQACIGFIQKDNYYIPNTVLKENCKSMVVEQYKILCIAGKKMQEEKYSEITYYAKDIDINKILASKELNKKFTKKLLS